MTSVEVIRTLALYANGWDESCSTGSKDRILLYASNSVTQQVLRYVYILSYFNRWFQGSGYFNSSCDVGNTGVLKSPQPDLLPDVFCLMVRMFLLMLVYISSINNTPIMIINRIFEHQNLLSLQLVSFLVGLRTYQHPCTRPALNILFFVFCILLCIFLNYSLSLFCLSSSFFYPFLPATRLSLCDPSFHSSFNF